MRRRIIIRNPKEYNFLGSEKGTVIENLS